MSVMEISMIDIRKRLVFLKLGRKKRARSYRVTMTALPFCFDISRRSLSALIIAINSKLVRVFDLVALTV